MPAWSDRLKELLGGKPARRAPKRRAAADPAKAYVKNASNRAAVIKEAMAVYRSRRGEMRGLLDRVLREMREKPPKTVREHDDLVRLLELRRAHVALKSLMSHDLRRYLVLSGIRGLLEEGGRGPAPVGPTARKPAPRKVSKR